jgi:hypothetical protein
MKTFLQIVLGLLALWVLWTVLQWAIGFLIGLLNLGIGLLWLALVIGAIVFVVGLIRRLLLRT